MKCSATWESENNWGDSYNRLSLLLRVTSRRVQEPSGVLVDSSSWENGAGGSGDSGVTRHSSGEDRAPQRDSPGDTQRGPCSFQPSSGWYMPVREVVQGQEKKLHKGLEGTNPRADRRPKFVLVPVLFFFFVSQMGNLVIHGASVLRRVLPQ